MSLNKTDIETATTAWLIGMGSISMSRQLAIEEVRRTGRVMDAATRHGVPRATLYRLLSR